MPDQAFGPDFIVDPQGNCKDVRMHSAGEFPRARRSADVYPAPSQSLQPSAAPKHASVQLEKRWMAGVVGLGVFLACLLGRTLLPVYSEYLRSSSSSSLPAEDLQAGRRFYYNGDYPQAITFYSMVIANHADAGDAYNERGMAYAAQGQSELALADYDRAAELMPGSAVVFNNRGTLYMAMQLPGKAIADFDQAIRLDSRLARAYCNRGLVQLYTDRYEQAIADFDKAIELTPESISKQLAALENRADPLGQGRQTGLALSQPYAELEVAYTYRGLAHMGRGEFDQALADYTKAIEIRPSFAQAYYHRGLLYHTRGSLKQAEADFRKVLELSSDLDLRQKAENLLGEIKPVY